MTKEHVLLIIILYLIVLPVGLVGSGSAKLSYSAACLNDYNFCGGTLALLLSIECKVLSLVYPKNSIGWYED
jgi:hypothetical protein